MSRLSSSCISRVAQIKGHLESSPVRGGATESNPLILYDLKSQLPPGTTWSPNVWKTRFVLNYKQIPYKTVWLSFPEIETTLKSLGFQPSSVSHTSGKEWYTLPVISDPSPESGGEPTLVVDSQVIAEYLDSKYPQRPILPEGTKAFQAMFVKWVQTNVLPHLIQLVAPQIIGILDGPDVDYFVRTREKMFGKKLSEPSRKTWARSTSTFPETEGEIS
ncbi:hypothetical protein FRB90_004699 [Tulasnella sp. 427]|nr:hypothetical protein FRB90_004699 [Tulasnella sp. 427]